MELYTIYNDLLNVAIADKGAELQSINHKDYGLEYLWNGDARFWSKKSPVLFPIVGSLKNNSYQYDGKTYHLNRHGFARDMDFAVKEKSDDAIVLTIESNKETLENYPFKFIFSVEYLLEENKLVVAYKVENTGDESMFFSVGAHPAFKVPLTEDTQFEDYYLQFDAVENGERWPLTTDGLIENLSTPVLQNTGKLPLTKELFYNDALVFKNLQSSNVSILSGKTSHGVKVSFKGFPYLGLWNAKNADFVCIEPWCGIADSVNASGKLDEKEGINSLAPNTTFERKWSIEVF